MITNWTWLTHDVRDKPRLLQIPLVDLISGIEKPANLISSPDLNDQANSFVHTDSTLQEVEIEAQLRMTYSTCTDMKLARANLFGMMVLIHCLNTDESICINLECYETSSPTRSLQKKCNLVS
jgi:hypothetical protein